jgi:nucleoid DNA-binding protein
MTKADLARAIHNRHGGLSTRECTAVTDLMLEIIKDRLAAGDKVCLGHLGVMEVVKRRSRRGRRPAAGKKPTTRLLVFRPARPLR